MDTLLKLLQPMITQIEALLLLAGVFLVLHLVLKHRFKKKKKRIEEIKKKIRASLSWEDADLSKLREYGGSALDATVVTAAASGMSILEAYLGEASPDQPLSRIFDEVISGSLFENAAGAGADAISGADAAVSAGADVLSGADAAADAVSGADTAAAAADVASGVEMAGNAADTGALDVIANSTDTFDATQHVPLVSAALFGLRTLRNVMRLAKRKQTGREAGINIGMDFVRIGVGGAGAMGLGKLGAAAGTAVAPGAGTMVGGGVGIFAGSLFGSQLVNNARRTLKWGKIERAQEYFGEKFVAGRTPEFAENFTDEFFKTEELRQRLLAERDMLEQYSAELDLYSDKEVSYSAVLSEESVDYIETVLAKAEYVKEHLNESILSTCNALTNTMTAKNAGVTAANLSGEMILQAPQCLNLTENEQAMVKDYAGQKAVSKDYPCRFETDGSAVLETIAMQLFDKFVPDIRKMKKEKKPVWLILFVLTMLGLAGYLACGLL